MTPVGFGKFVRVIAREEDGVDDRVHTVQNVVASTVHVPTEPEESSIDAVPAVKLKV